jgi:hypothetical protein
MNRLPAVIRSHRLQAVENSQDRLADLKLDRDRAKTSLDRIKAQAVAPTEFDSQTIERFDRVMRENIT